MSADTPLAWSRWWDYMTRTKRKSRMIGIFSIANGPTAAALSTPIHSGKALIEKREQT
jgi:hypothetical protein